MGLEKLKHREALMAKTASKPKQRAKRPASVTRPAKALARRAKSSAKRARATLARRKPARKPAREPQIFMVSHHNEADFQTGLRSYAHYRDLGISRATDGLAQAHVIRFVPPCRPEEVSKLHYHDVEFQMVYVLRGWIKTDIDGHGAQVMRAGSCWIQPPRIEHKVLDYSDDCEVLEVILPADFKTVELE
jgi:mannose-6-phosphate isomerase-like protein (cupin superfamily)